MKTRIISDYREIDQERETVLVLGYFDALHLGHKALFEQAMQVAEEQDLEVVVLTFLESPQLAFSRFQPDLLLHLNSPQKRCQKFAEFGVDRLYLTHFTSRFAQISSDDFIQHYIRSLKAKAIVVGFDYKFGHNRTDSDYLARNFEGQVITVAEVQDQGQKISSTRIRQNLAQGQVAEANRLLGEAFSTRGIVVHGDARGRTIGFPTANLAPIDRTHLPADGVYVSDVKIGERIYRAMTSLGKNITFGGQDLRLETHVFEFDGDIYGETLEIYWLDKIRDMEKFAGIEDLVLQLQKDKEFAKNWKKG